MKNLVKFDGKAVEKLIDVVSKGIGTLYKPRSIRNEADAEAYRLETLANAEAKKALIKNDAQLEIAERAKLRLAHQEVNRQENIEAIVEKALPHLSEETSEEEVDPDWRTRFFQKAQDVSNEDLQDMWARILASEVSIPGHVSLRTLEVISNVSKSEADLFGRACCLATTCTKIWKIGRDSAFDEYGLSYGDLMQLREAGLVHDSDMLSSNHSVVNSGNSPFFIVNVGKQLYMFKNKNKSNTAKTTLVLNQIAFTKAGSEMCRLISAEPHKVYFNKLLEHYRLSNEITEMVPSMKL